MVSFVTSCHGDTKISSLSARWALSNRFGVGLQSVRFPRIGNSFSFPSGDSCMRIAKSALLSLCISGLLAFAGAHANGPINANGDDDLKPSAKGWGEGQAFSKPDNNAKPGGGGSSNGINYHGGPLILGTTHVYYI